MKTKNHLLLLASLLLTTPITVAQTTIFGSTGLNQTNSSEPILFKNSGTEKMRILPNGNVGIGTTTPAEKLHINGNLKVDGTIISTSSTPTQITTLQTSRIKLMDGDTVIRFGDSTVYLDPNRNSIYSTPVTYQSVTYRGIGLGREALGKGSYSVALGFGVETGTSATNAIVIGSGSGLGSSNRLTNSTANSLLIGFNKNNQFFLNGTSGNVGIGTTSPLQKLDVTHADGTGGIALNQTASTTFKSELGFYKNGAKKWAIGNDYNNDGTQSFFIYDAIHGDNRFYINPDGNIGLGTGSPSARLEIFNDGQHSKVISVWNPTSAKYDFLVKADGKVYAREVHVYPVGTAFPDYVFADTYKLKTITELSEYIKTNKHLPNIPSAAEVDKTGSINITDLQLKMLEKLEEQALYIINLQAQIDQLNAKLLQSK